MSLNIENNLNNIFGIAKKEEVLTTPVLEAEVVDPETGELTIKVPAATDIVVAQSSEIAVAEPEEEKTQAELDAEADYEFSRESLKNISAMAANGLSEALVLAKQLEKPAGFEAVANMVKAAVETHRALQEMHQSAAEIRIAAKTAAGSANTTNINVAKGVVFAGTPDELLRLVDTTRQ